MECTVNGRYCNLTVMYYEKILHVTFYYPWYMQICSTDVFFLFFLLLFFFFPTSASQHPCRFERTRSHMLTSCPSITPYTVAQPHGLVCWGVMCRSLDGSSSSGHCLTGKIGCCCLVLQITSLVFLLAAESFWPLKGQGLSCWLVEAITASFFFFFFLNHAESKRLLLGDGELMFYIKHAENSPASVLINS